jgi:DNA relaxase NicK
MQIPLEILLVAGTLLAVAYAGVQRTKRFLAERRARTLEAENAALTNRWLS